MFSDNLYYSIADTADTPITSTDSWVLTPRFVIALVVIILIVEMLPLLMRLFGRMKYEDRLVFRNFKYSRMRKAGRKSDTALKPFWSIDGRFDHASRNARLEVLEGTKTRADIGVYFNSEWRWLPEDMLTFRWDHGDEAVSRVDDILNASGNGDAAGILNDWANTSDYVDAVKVDYGTVPVYMVIVGRRIVPVIIGSTDVDVRALELFLSAYASGQVHRTIIDSTVFIVPDDSVYANGSASVASGIAVGLRTALCNLEVMRLETMDSDGKRIAETFDQSDEEVAKEGTTVEAKLLAGATEIHDKVVDRFASVAAPRIASGLDVDELVETMSMN